MLASLTATACSGSSDTSNTTAPTQTVVNPTNVSTLTGTIPAPTPGQSPPTVVVTFNSAATGSGTVTVTSAAETLSNGTVFTGVQIGLILGTGGVSNCVAPAGATPFFTVASPTALTATYTAGANCFIVSSGDQSATAGPVTFTLSVLAY
jgi:hypothetical protein